MMPIPKLILHSYSIVNECIHAAVIAFKFRASKCESVCILYHRIPLALRGHDEVSTKIRYPHLPIRLQYFITSYANAKGELH